MFKFYFIKNLYHLIILHISCCLIFAFIYNELFNNIDEHYLLNNNISKEGYIKDRIINSIYLSVNLQTTTGHVDFYPKSLLGKSMAVSQMLLSIFITLGIFRN